MQPRNPIRPQALLKLFGPQAPIRHNSSSFQSAMNRPRNRQPRKPQSERRGGGGSQGPSRRSPGTPQQAAGTVPTVRQVVPGAGVYIVLKDDQPTGEETAGIVQDVLTRGNHPRGIKVRLRDGQIGRVQRLRNAEGDAPNTTATATGPQATASRWRQRGGATDVRYDENPAEPPSRSLADFLPPSFTSERAEAGDAGVQSGGPVVRCPLCDDFEGDEPAVTHHIERAHLE